MMLLSLGGGVSDAVLWLVGFRSYSEFKNTQSILSNTTLSTAGQENHSGKTVQMKADTIQDLSVSVRHDSLTNTL